MPERVAVYVYAQDPISQTGVAAHLRGRPETYVLADDAIDRADVAVVVTDFVDDSTVRIVRGIRRDGCPKVVLVVAHLDDGSLMRAVEIGVAGLLRRSEVTPEALARAVVAASYGNGTLAPDLIGCLLHQVSRLRSAVPSPRDIGRDGLNDRERDVLRLLADGRSTLEIATEMAYSERTIKTIIHDLTTRLRVRNRAHAVAHAIKSGMV